MPNRYLRESYLQSESVNAVSFQAEVFWTRLLVAVDDFGRCEANPRILRPRLFPLRLHQVREADMQRWIAECEKAGLVRLYTADQKQHLQMMRWEKGRAEESRFPEPPPEILSVCYRKHAAVRSRKHRRTAAPDSDSDSDSGTERGAKAPAARPKLDEWLSYAAELKWPLRDAQRAFDHYESNGWKVGGKAAVKDWRACARNCHDRNNGHGGKPDHDAQAERDRAAIARGQFLP